MLLQLTVSSGERLHLDHVAGRVCGLRLGVNNCECLDVVVAGKASIQFGTRQFECTIQIVSWFAVEINQLPQYELIISHRVSS